MLKYKMQNHFFFLAGALESFPPFFESFPAAPYASFFLA